VSHDRFTYESPEVSDYGDLQELTANNSSPAFVDVPQGTPIAVQVDGDDGGGMS
jgi:hypothetical protein